MKIINQKDKENQEYEGLVVLKLDGKSDWVEMVYYFVEIESVCFGKTN